MNFQQPRGRIDFRIAILGLVLAAHGLLVFALAGGLPWLAGRANELPLEIKLIGTAAHHPQADTIAPLPPAEPARPQPPQPPRPHAARPPAPHPHPAQAAAPPAPSAATSASQVVAAMSPQTQAGAPTAAPQAAETPAARLPVRVPAQALAKDCATPEYPRKSYRYGEQGTVTLSLLVGIDGRVAESRIAQSSGYKDLDNAALAALSLCRFKPGTADGKPEQSWATLRYQWKIE